MKAFRKDFFREILKNKGRFLSVFFISLLGAAFFSGIRSAEGDMKTSADAYYDQTNYMDLRVLGTLGLTDADVEDIAKVLRQRGCMKEFWVCPIGDYQRKIALDCEPKLRIVLYRRLMFRVANAIAEKCGAKAVVTGESLGQVASQTMENMIATSNASEKMVLRPLIGMDKLEIIDEARNIGTFDISSQDASDCCTLFMPKMPETHANLEEVLSQEEKWFNEAWVEEILKNAERHVL